MKTKRAVYDAIAARVCNMHTELIKEFGLVSVINAIDEVSSHVGDVYEIGTSDVSCWVQRVTNVLHEQNAIA